MGRISKLLAEVLASNYIKTIESLLSQFNWDDADIGFLDIKKSCYILIDDISNIGEYDGENASKHLKVLKDEAKNLIYVLKNLIENQNENQ
jgi:hypothetical protein